MKPILFAVLAGLCWGVGEIFTRSVLHSREIGPFAAIAVRSTIALPAIWLAYFVAAHLLRSPGEVPGWFGQASGSTWLKLIVGSGLIAGAAAMIFFYAALSLGEISRIKPIAFALAPTTAVLLGWIVLSEPMSARKAAGVALILIGIVLLSTPSANSHRSQPKHAASDTAQLKR